jgi:hypothetical protein
VIALASLCAALVFPALSLAGSGAKLDGNEDFFQLAANGFAEAVDGPHPEGGRGNLYAWSGAWFKGRFYVGTGRNLNCFGYAGRDFRGCPDTPTSEERAQIWAYTPAGEAGLRGRWELVYRSPLLFGDLPRDIGYRGMAVCETGGKRELWVATGGLGGRILHTADGRTFAEASNVGLHNSASELLLGTADLAYRGLTCWRGRLVAAPAASSLDGDVPYHPVALANADPADPESPWEVIANFQEHPTLGRPGNLGAFSVATFAGALYLAVTNRADGVELWRGTGCKRPDRPCAFAWARVLDRGAGRPRSASGEIDNVGASDMEAFRGALYLAVSDSAATNRTRAELLRVRPDGSWELLVGKPRQRSAMPSAFRCAPDPGAADRCVPLAAMGPGFGGGPPAYADGDARYIWRLAGHRGRLFAGTLDVGLALELLSSRNGTAWSAVTTDGFGAGATAVRTLVSVPRWPGGPALVVGTLSGQPGGGLQVWAGTCSASGPPRASLRSTLPLAGSAYPEVRLAVDGDGDGMVEVELDGSRSADAFCGGPVRLAWYEGDVATGPLSGREPIARGPALKRALSTGPDFTDHTFTLRVVDEEGMEARLAMKIRASRNRPPVATIASSPAPAAPGAAVELVDRDGDGSVEARLHGSCSDPEGALSRCFWRVDRGAVLTDPASLSTAVVLGTDLFSPAVLLVAVDDHGYEHVSRVTFAPRAPVRDVAVRGLATPPATAGVAQAVAVTVRNEGDVAETVDVALVDDASGAVAPASRAVFVPVGATVTTSFTWTPAAAGARTLVATAARHPDERDGLDNRRAIRVDVAAAGARR